MQGNPIQNAGDLIDALGGNTTVSKLTGAHYQTVVAWRNRKRIPVEHWAAILSLASEKGIEISTNHLVALFAPRKSAA